MNAGQLTPKEGGAAFPCEYQVGALKTIDCGMSLRDWFAGQALAGLAANIHLGEHYSHNAEHAYALADAMLTRRKT